MVYRIPDGHLHNGTGDLSRAQDTIVPPFVEVGIALQSQDELSFKR
jgi:hypothetical protein